VRLPLRFMLGTAAMMGGLIALQVAPAQAREASSALANYDWSTPQCHDGVWSLPTLALPPSYRFEVHNDTVRKGPRVYKLYARFSVDPEHLLPDQGANSELWAHGCGGGLAPIQVQNTAGDYGFRFIFPDSTLFYNPHVSDYTETIGQINQKYAELGFETGFLGFPTSDETATPNKLGRFNQFEHGSIYWSPGTGAHEVHGNIRDKWASLGWENGLLGFPTTDETATPTKLGRFNIFQGGSIYWSPSTGAHEIHGAIRDLWARMGWENSDLGFPTSDEYSIPGGRRSMFQTREHFPSANVFTVYGIDWTPQNGAWAWSNTIPYF